jgi:hypothetical protein
MALDAKVALYVRLETTTGPAIARHCAPLRDWSGSTREPGCERATNDRHALNPLVFRRLKF